ncbi:hypothetical protein HYQ45_007903 [Verticillium longisporum]|uniref:Uncharacterized protein n=1 Tax=Verticillium longisporum TaxID=100787 RepID=A0A8I3ARL8_VERLO|nr:hypothetical protein HYQ45_007903 [Verticillium longisporum]
MDWLGSSFRFPSTSYHLYFSKSGSKNSIDHRVLLAGLLHLHTSFHHTAAATTSTSSSDPPGRVTSPSGHRSTTSHIATAEGLKALMSVDLRTSLNCLRHPSRFMPVSRTQLSRVHTGDSIQNLPNASLLTA